MKLVSLFIYNPVSGWNPKDIHEYAKRYSCTDEFTEALCIKEDMKLQKKTVDCMGNAFVIHLELKSNYSIKYPESNQALYKADAVIVCNY